jgi:hypothetical protein
LPINGGDIEGRIAVAQWHIMTKQGHASGSHMAVGLKQEFKHNALKGITSFLLRIADEITAVFMIK